MDFERTRRRFTPIRRRLCVGSGSGEVLLLELDGTSGKIDLFGAARSGDYPSFLAFHKSRAVAYAAHEASSELAALSLSGARFGVLGRTPSGGAGPAYVSLDRSDSYLFCANYAGGTISVIALATDGSLGDVTFSGPCGENPHSIVVDPSNRFVFVPALGSDQIFQFRFDRSNGKLHPNAKSSRATRAGSGPRHLVFHPEKAFAYVSYEHTSEIACYAFDPEFGTLEERQVISSLPHAAVRHENTGADLHVAPSGRFLYASNRGHDSIAVFGIKPDATLSLLGHAETLGKTPRNFALAQHGEFLVVANQDSNSLTTFQVDTASGVLTRLATTPGIPSPYWVGFF